MLIFLMMLVIGILIGFVGGGGAGFVLAMLVSAFGIPVHTAIGTSMTAMVFTVLSGAVSHIREGNTVLKVGIVVGLFGAVGSYIGTIVVGLIPSQTVIWISSGLLFLSSLMLLVRNRLTANQDKIQITKSEKHFWIAAPCIGLVTGFCSGCFGIGATPLIQLGMMILLGLTLQQAAATSMLVILPVAFFGGLGFIKAGYVDLPLLLQIIVGTMTGSYIGAKFTNRAPRKVFIWFLIVLPVLAGVLLLVR